MAEGVGFEPTVGLPLLLISSQVPLTTQPPFHVQMISHGGCVVASLFAENGVAAGRIFNHGWTRTNTDGGEGFDQIKIRIKKEKDSQRLVTGSCIFSMAT